jgi:hypothetical protein
VDQQAFIETLFNRSAARNQSLLKTITDKGYFPASSLTKIDVPAAHMDAYRDMVDAAKAGSNVARYGTGNAFGSVGFGGGPMVFRAPSGEKIGVEKDTLPWYNRMRRLAPDTGTGAPPLLARPMPTPQKTTSVNFQPTITIHGNATDADQRAMDSRLRLLARDFVEQFKAAQYHERRLSYEGGYA